MGDEMQEKSLDQKVHNILGNPQCGDFILADAKDADMAAGLAGPGKSPEHHAAEGRFRTLQEYRDLIRENVKQGLVDIMLMSVSTSEVLTLRERLFDDSHITPAIRANDTSDIWLATGGKYSAQPARPFRTAQIDHAMCGQLNCTPEQRRQGVDLGLFSLTFNNDVQTDHAMLSAYSAFRAEAEQKGFRHFLEVFDPNACGESCPTDLGRFIADNIVRALAGVPASGRPVFLKIAYHGPAAMEAIASYDRSLIPGILGGSSGTTFDAFHQLWEARKYGARAALYGRMINNSEHQTTFIQHLRWIADGEINNPAEAVKSYHGALQSQQISPYRSLEDDLVATARGSSYGASPQHKTQVVTPEAAPGVNSQPAPRARAHAPNNFADMTPEQKVAWQRAKWDRVLG